MSKPTRGRPAKAAPRKSRSVRFSDAEWAQLEALAQGANEQPGEYLRRRALSPDFIGPALIGCSELVHELHQRLCQLAHRDLDAFAKRARGELRPCPKCGGVSAPSETFGTFACEDCGAAWKKKRAKERKA